MIINLGFTRKRELNKRLPPGQHETHGFPVLSLGPTPTIDPSKWSLEIDGLVSEKKKINLSQLKALTPKNLECDIHCVTRWSKFNTKWKGVDFESIIKLCKPSMSASVMIAHSADGYSSNIPLADMKGGKALVAYGYEGEDIEAIHGGPVRLIIPHLYFWKSAKWLTGLTFKDQDEPGFWETRGYHNYGDPWREQRYTND